MIYISTTKWNCQHIPTHQNPLSKFFFIKLLTFNQEGQTVVEPKEFKMTLQCQGMNIDGVIREKIERKRLQEFIEKAVLT